MIPAGFALPIDITEYVAWYLEREQALDDIIEYLERKMDAKPADPGTGKDA